MRQAVLHLAEVEAVDALVQFERGGRQPLVEVIEHAEQAVQRLVVLVRPAAARLRHARREVELHRQQELSPGRVAGRRTPVAAASPPPRTAVTLAPRHVAVAGASPAVVTRSPPPVAVPAAPPPPPPRAPRRDVTFPRGDVTALPARRADVTATRAPPPGTQVAAPARHLATKLAGGQDVLNDTVAGTDGARLLLADERLQRRLKHDAQPREQTAVAAVGRPEEDLGRQPQLAGTTGGCERQTGAAVTARTTDGGSGETTSDTRAAPATHRQR